MVQLACPVCGGSYKAPGLHNHLRAHEIAPAEATRLARVACEAAKRGDQAALEAASQAIKDAAAIPTDNTPEAETGEPAPASDSCDATSQGDPGPEGRQAVGQVQTPPAPPEDVPAPPAESPEELPGRTAMGDFSEPDTHPKGTTYTKEEEQEQEQEEEQEEEEEEDEEEDEEGRRWDWVDSLAAIGLAVALFILALLSRSNDAGRTIPGATGAAGGDGGEGSPEPAAGGGVRDAQYAELRAGNGRG